MKGKIIFPQGKCKSVVPDNHIEQMKNALKVIEYPDAIIGPKTVKEVLELNADKTGYSHCIFNELLSEKIINDYNTITDGLELLKFYKERNKYFTAFDSDIKSLATKIEDQDKTKFATKDIIIDTTNCKVTSVDEKIWLVYLNGELKNQEPDTLPDAIKYAKNCMFYHNYNKIEIKIKGD